MGKPASNVASIGNRLSFPIWEKGLEGGPRPPASGADDTALDGRGCGRGHGLLNARGAGQRQIFFESGSVIDRGA